MKTQNVGQSLAIGMALGLVALGHAWGEQAPSVPKGKVRLFILAGQSNMAGLDDTKSFAPALRQAFPHDEVIVVRHAVSGTPIRLWFREWKAPEGADGSWTADLEKQGSLYTVLMEKVRTAIRDRTPDTVSFVWMQGERDAKGGVAAAYEAGLRGLIGKIRTDMKSDEATVVIGRLSDHLNGTPQWDAVRAIQVKVAEDDPHGAWVDTDAMNEPGNELHYSKAGYAELGRQFAAETIALLQKGTPADMARRAAELKSLRWGMFICWSFSTFSGTEWTPGVKDLASFKATGMDTDQWARTAKEAGMGYILFLTKHHDGFCLWDTKTTDRKVTNSPLARDVLAELRKSCDAHGIRLALYFSEGEFNDNKDYHPGGYTPEMKKAQLKELLTRYGPIEYIWFDHAQGTGGVSHPETIAWCKSFQPGCFVGFNHGDQAGADIRLGEMGKPGSLDDHKAAGPHMRDVPSTTYLLAEFTYPILPDHEGGAAWFYSLPRHDGLCHPAEKLYADYLGAGKYGNIFSIDVGPNYAGRLRDIDVTTLRKVGDMIRRQRADPSAATECCMQ